MRLKKPKGIVKYSRTIKEARFQVWPVGIWFVVGAGLVCISTNGLGWEHVSVFKKSGNLPDWNEMCKVKNLFWEEEEAVMQVHPPKSLYVNNAPVLHLWRPIESEIPLPDPIMVGIPGVKEKYLRRIFGLKFDGRTSRNRGHAIK